MTSPARLTPVRSRSLNKSATPYFYLLPAVVLVLGVLGFCIAFTVNTSFYNWDGVGPGATAAGGANYLAIFHDPVFWGSLAHMAAMVVTIPISMFLGLLFAALLHSRVIARPVFKAFLFLPVVLSPAVMAPTFRQMYGPDGLVDATLKAVGLGNLAEPWLSRPGPALIVLMLIVIWSSTGFSFLLYFASLTAIDAEILEAARIDGAGNPRIFFGFLVPMSRAATSTLILLGLIGVMKIFDVPYLITAGGPAHATEFLGTYVFLQSVQDFNAGYAASLSVAMIAISVFLAFIQLRQGARRAVES